MLALIALVGICAIAYTESINTDDDLALDDDFAIDSLFVTSAPHPLPKPDKFSHGRDDTDREEGEETEDTEDTEDTDTDHDTDSEWPEECNDLYIRFQEVYYDIYGYVVNGISPTCDEQWSLVNSYRDLYECSGGDFEDHIAETFCAETDDPETDDGAPDWLETSCICDDGCVYDGSDSFDAGYGDCSTYDNWYDNAGYCGMDGACGVCCECDSECGLDVTETGDDCDYDGSDSFDAGYGDCMTYSFSNAGYCGMDGACGVCCECDSECGLDDYTSTSTSTSGCRYDITGDEIANILDIVLLVNTILEESYVVSHDFDGSGGLDILDIVMLVTAIVEGEECAY